MLLTSTLFECSGYQRSVHANICWWSVVPLHLLEEIGSWGVARGLWCCWLFAHQIEGEAVLDYKELMGRELGREGILQNLQGPEYLRC